MPNHPSNLSAELLSHQAFLKRLATDLVGNDADDLVQDVWHRALEHPPQHGGQLRGWLARVARNLAANHWRGDARRKSREAMAVRDQASSSELETRFEQRKELVAALDSLSSSQRETLLLRYFEGLTPSEIACRQSSSLATVKTRLRRGLAQLREALDERHGGDRATWMSAVTALAAPESTSITGATLLTVGMTMGLKLKLAAAIGVAAACIYFATREPRSELPQTASVEAPVTKEELALTEPASLSEELPLDAARRTPIEEEALVSVSTTHQAHVLRVVLEGVTAGEAQLATVGVKNVDGRENWPTQLQSEWLFEGHACEIGLDPFMKRDEQDAIRMASAVEIEIDHPHFLSKRLSVPLSRGTKRASGRIIYEARTSLARPEYWPQFNLAVRDADTRAHLSGIEFRVRAGVGNASWGRNESHSFLGRGLQSPIALLGGRDTEESQVKVAGLALSPSAGEFPQLVELLRRATPDRGVIVSARAPGYAWGSITLDVSKGEDHELLLGPDSTLEVQLTNVELDRYDALGTQAMLCIYWIRKDNGNQYVHFEPIDETLSADGYRLASLAPGGYRVTVELAGGGWPNRPVLASGETLLGDHETREVVLALSEPPALPQRATLSGEISFPLPAGFDRERDVRLQLYEVSKYGEHGEAARYQGAGDIEIALANLVRTDGSLPTWSFDLEDMPIGRYQVHLWPFLKSWMIDVPAEGATGVKLVIPELAEVLVETVDKQSGERVPIDVIYHRHEEALPNRVHIGRAEAEVEEAGRFRFWTAPGPVLLYPFDIPDNLDYGTRTLRQDVVAGFQLIRFELEPVYAFRIEFCEDGTALDQFDEIAADAYSPVASSLRGIDHEGRLTTLRLQGTTLEVEVTAPGLYEFSLEGVEGERFLAIPTRHVEVGPGEVTEVVIELRRK